MYNVLCIQGKGFESMREIREKAFAKINLGLDVIRRREDGYHEVRMIMQNLQLYDQIRLYQTGKKGIKGECNLPWLPVNEKNLVYKAAKLMMDEFQIEQGIFIKLEKKIPSAAGLAGGSSDAAAVMRGLNRMFDLGLSDAELARYAVKIGADVPYCIKGGTALAEGIGEKLTFLPPAPKCFILLAKPDADVSTKFVYTNLKADQLVHHPDIDGQLKALEDKDLNTLAAKMENVLESVTAVQYPVVEKIKQDMVRYGALNAMMSGSGPTVFGIFDEEEKLQYAYRKMKEKRWCRQLFMTKIR